MAGKRLVEQRVIVVTLVLVLASCSNGSTGTTVREVLGSTTTLLAAPPNSSTTTRIASTTTSSLMLPELPTMEQLEPTFPGSSPPMWVRSDYEFDRHRSYWLGVMGEDFVLMSWRWPYYEFAVQRSADGLVWTDPVPTRGLPVQAEPWYWDMATPRIAASSAGMIAIYETGSGSDGALHRDIYTSRDGEVWVHDPLPAIENLTRNGGPFNVAAIPDGFAVWATADERQPLTDALFVKPIDGNWTRVDLPARGDPWSNWVVAAHGEFLVRVATHLDAVLGAQYVFRVDTSGAVTVEATPTDYPPIEWNYDLLVWDQYAFDPHPSLYAGSDGNTWYRLPMPEYESDAPDETVEADGDAGEAWRFDTYTAGPPGITGAGGDAGDFWSFYPEGFVAIEIHKNGHDITIWGDTVDLSTEPRLTNVVDARTWFDVATGTLFVPNTETGEPLIAITCDEMRFAATEASYAEGLMEVPPQDLWHSPDGTSWHYQNVEDLFGTNAYVEQTATTPAATALLVDPTSDRPTPDPPGCPLNLYPEELPLRIWTTTP